MARDSLSSRRRPAISEAVAVIGVLFAAEFIFSKLLSLPSGSSQSYRLYTTSLVRSVEIALLILYWRIRFGSLSLLGLRGTLAVRGIVSGLWFSLGLGLFALLLEAFFRLALSKSFLSMISGPVPSSPLPLILAGVILGPVFEELAFRGFLYSSLRGRFGVLFSTVATALIFGALHYKGGAVPLVQVAGGAIFSIAYEKSGSLASPLLVHSLGNFAIFSLPYILK